MRPLEERRKAIRKFREELGLSQAELASLAGIGQAMLSRFERGQRDLSQQAMGRIEDAIVKALSQRDRSAQAAKAELVNTWGTKDDPLSNLRLLAAMYRVEIPAEDQGRETRERVMKKLIAEQQALIHELNRIVDELVELHKEVKTEKDQKIVELQGRIALLADLLNVETTQGLAQREVEDLREQLSHKSEDVGTKAHG